MHRYILNSLATIIHMKNVFSMFPESWIAIKIPNSCWYRAWIPDVILFESKTISLRFELRGSLGIPRLAPSELKFFVLGAVLRIPSEPRSSKLRLIVLLSNRMTSGIHAQHVRSALSQKSIYLCIVVSPWKAQLSSKDRDKDCNIYTLSLESCMAKLGETLLNHRVRKVQTTTTTIPAASCFKFVEKKVLTSRPSPLLPS